MIRLHKNRIDLFSKYLQDNHVDPELYNEILDHLACETEERLWEGDSFEKAYEGIISAADSKTLRFLNVEHKHLLAMENSLNDIVFEGRNKLYGAYALRKGYSQTVQRSMILGVTLFLLMVMLPNLYARLTPEPKDSDIRFEIKLEKVDIKPDAFFEPKTPPPPPKEIPNTVKYTVPEVVQDEKVITESVPPVIEDLSKAQPGQETVEGEGATEIIAPPVSSIGESKANITEVLPAKDEVFIHVEQNPEFMGGMSAMASFLQKNLRYPQKASSAGIQGKVFVTFTVGADGQIENVGTIKGIGFGCDEEALRVIKLMPKWNPGKQGGRPVKVKFTMPISFQLDQ
ncbi:hypothetical protein DYBT9275_03075 [Dyadobacter sp. CECT 9275]|uniref:TonB C-terminal domain-containing protein n=1 Tax=Dyadobacter helix TaxID=2822344 RepID=A0A916JDA7_9BACT|nr:energy transducer TonB [Dyadobacter sp. CECT 9275]CAG5003155.1 hypothetical protein DYBT9275_03075 [Dyadobacter sp. CECT 9275]